MSEGPYFGLILFFILIGVAGFFITMRIAYRNSKAKDTKDEDVANGARAHNVLMNPVFIVYILAAIFVTGYIIYWIMIT
ncbi:hypothetical protein [Jeotgalibacillus campisalis]|uniref:Short-chain dehydrogenase n=1 Tax=Jeotgalibacillus campisalis TaxID=220754 RepID=A0A0C2VU82_9BACL|nr:hypothetical protein [Jeotgalibacillus campisalis]KIL47533.1 hypothetical protein KR50_17000 [Jeotgalibacillus campisalis]